MLNLPRTISTRNHRERKQPPTPSPGEKSTRKHPNMNVTVAHCGWLGSVLYAGLQVRANDGLLFTAIIVEGGLGRLSATNEYSQADLKFILDAKRTMLSFLD